MRKVIFTLMAVILIISFGFINVSAVNYIFTGPNNNDFHRSTNYADIFGSEFNFGGPNVIDFADPFIFNNMQPTTLPSVIPWNPANPNTPTGMGPPVLPIHNPASHFPDFSSFGTAHTPTNELIRADGSIGTLEIPTLSIRMRAWEGTTNESMNRGLGHFPTSSGWNGNIALAGHNRGARYTIGSIRNLQIGDVIRYTTIHGTRSYAVSYVGVIDENDWSFISATEDNRITLITCLANQPSLRVVVQAREQF